MAQVTVDKVLSCAELGLQNFGGCEQGVCACVIEFGGD